MMGLHNGIPYPVHTSSLQREEYSIIKQTSEAMHPSPKRTQSLRSSACHIDSDTAGLGPFSYDSKSHCRWSDEITSVLPVHQKYVLDISGPISGSRVLFTKTQTVHYLRCQAVAVVACVRRLYVSDHHTFITNAPRRYRSFRSSFEFFVGSVYPVIHSQNVYWIASLEPTIRVPPGRSSFSWFYMLGFISK